MISTIKSAIETHLHRISNMTNRWVYMNDDWAFTQKTCFQDFYANGATRIYTINSWVCFRPLLSQFAKYIFRHHSGKGFWKQKNVRSPVRWTDFSLEMEIVTMIVICWNVAGTGEIAMILLPRVTVSKKRTIQHWTMQMSYWTVWKIMVDVIMLLILHIYMIQKLWVNYKPDFKLNSISQALTGKVQTFSIRKFSTCNVSQHACATKAQ